MNFTAKRLRSTAMRSVLRPLLSWQPLEAPKPGYSVIIGCSVDLVSILRANLQLLTRQRRENLQDLFLAFDCTVDQARESGLETALREDFGKQLPLQFVYHGAFQNRVIRAFNWGWTYSWINWSLSLSKCSTRYALIHDLDAMLIDPNLLESRFAATRDANAHFSGTAYYHCNGIDPADELLTTFEMFCDVQYLRANFKPLDLFNLTTVWKSKRVEFDTLLRAQTTGARKLLLPISTGAMVHPSQMICQYVAVRGDSDYVPPANNNVLMIPYFMELGGDSAVLREHQQAVDSSDGRFVKCFGKTLDFRNFTLVHAQWLTQQAHRLDAAVHGSVRPEIARYFGSIEALATKSSQQAPVAA